LVDCLTLSLTLLPPKKKKKTKEKKRKEKKKAISCASSASFKNHRARLTWLDGWRALKIKLQTLKQRVKNTVLV